MRLSRSRTPPLKRPRHRLQFARRSARLRSKFRSGRIGGIPKRLSMSESVSIRGWPKQGNLDLKSNIQVAVITPVNATRWGGWGQKNHPDLVSKLTEILKFSESAEPCKLAHTLLSGPGIAWLRRMTDQGRVSWTRPHLQAVRNRVDPRFPW
jgi:hypothetical protein